MSVFGVAPAIVQWTHYVAYVGKNASLTLNNNNNNNIGAYEEYIIALATSSSSYGQLSFGEAIVHLYFGTDNCSFVFLKKKTLF